MATKPLSDERFLEKVLRDGILGADPSFQTLETWLRELRARRAADEDLQALAAEWQCKADEWAKLVEQDGGAYTNAHVRIYDECRAALLAHFNLPEPEPSEPPMPLACQDAPAPYGDLPAIANILWPAVRRLQGGMIGAQEIADVEGLARAVVAALRAVQPATEPGAER